MATIRVSKEFAAKFKRWAGHQIDSGALTEADVVEFKSDIRESITEGAKETSMALLVPMSLQERYEYWMDYFTRECAFLDELAAMGTGITERVRARIAAEREAT